MEWFVRWFIRSSVAWLVVGVLLGVCMAFVPAAYAYRPAHMHANLLGFVSMMIFGVGYHVLPRFAGRALHRRTWAAAHLWLANAGLALQVGGWLLRPSRPEVGAGVVGLGGVLTAVGCLLFAANVWVTVGPRVPLEGRARPLGRPAAAAAGRGSASLPMATSGAPARADSVPACGGGAP